MCKLMPQTSDATYLTCRPSLLHPISNKLKKKNKQTNPGNMGGLQCGCVKRSVKRFYFVVFIHHCKTVIKADQKSSFYPSINDILYQKYLKKRQCHCDNVALSEPTKTNKQKARISHSKVHPVSSFAPCISGLHTFGRKQRFLCFSTMHHAMYGSI